MYQIGILTVSDRASEGTYEDRSGPLIAQILGEKTPWHTFFVRELLPPWVRESPDWRTRVNAVHAMSRRARRARAG